MCMSVEFSLVYSSPYNTICTIILQFKLIVPKTALCGTILQCHVEITILYLMTNLKTINSK